MVQGDGAANVSNRRLTARQCNPEKASGAEAPDEFVATCGVGLELLPALFEVAVTLLRRDGVRLGLLLGGLLQLDLMRGRLLELDVVHRGRLLHLDRPRIRSS